MNSTRSNPNRNPRVLLVTTELAHLPQGMVGNADWLTARAGGVAEVTASLVSALYEQGIDIHIALPDYRSLFRNRVQHPVPEKELFYRNKSPLNRVHLAADRILFHQPRLCYGGGLDGDKVALAFQREVINDIIPRVQPDLIHCNDWMTGLIPAMARQFNIPCLFTFHNTHTCNLSMAQIEDRGIDAAGFWEHLYFNRMPVNYAESRGANPVDLLTSGVFGAHFVNTVSATFLQEILQGEHPFVDPALEQVLMERCQDECAGDIRNAPDPSFDPATDKALFRRYNTSDHAPAKQFNKLFLQDKLGLVMDSQAPLFFWPSRLDMHQKGCPLLSEILHEVVANH
jgi:starch synthase